MISLFWSLARAYTTYYVGATGTFFNGKDVIASDYFPKGKQICAVGNTIALCLCVCLLIFF